ncbi:MAG TPA: efflux RND transporter periplasmic adaptor subunit [Ramlibacter sp.]|uniref:efflux RND transporter periplasmic adaptor subunit n=1 Tax=Ramlibacter sp. TaxID=1917967 RepID=UPI002D0A8448|nr:efflux RND transporter periplasmic adaptor subunit [Ramlibacter sp.]HVZ43520.1 efflux RND transporter periplasmic adaptor subunit [Ramlibacter sp.]
MTASGTMSRLAVAFMVPAAICVPAVSQVAHPAARVASPAVAMDAASGGAVPEIRAQLSPRRYTTIAAEIGARINRISAPEGSAFHAGQSLVSFDCSLQQAQLARVKVALDIATKQLATQTRLSELNAVGHQEVEQAEGEVAKQRAEIGQIQVMLSKCHIAAPFSGRVAEQKVREQQFVQPGQALLEIIDDSVLEVEFIMPSRWLASVHPGSMVQFAVDETGKTYPAKVTRLAARVDPVSQSVKVVAAIEGRPRELIAGMSGRLIVNR